MLRRRILYANPMFSGVSSNGVIYVQTASEETKIRD